MRLKKAKDEEDNVEGREAFSYTVNRFRPKKKVEKSEQRSSSKLGLTPLDPAIRDYLIEKLDILSQYVPEQWTD